MKNFILLIFLFCMLIYSCGKEKFENTGQTYKQTETGSDSGTTKVKEMKITSSAFKEGEMIPSKYTCDGENISPQMQWTGFPEKTKSFALICDDPDAPSGDWVHWVVYNIPQSVTQLPENFPKDKTTGDGTKLGTTDFRKTGYGGPCPPGGTHRYYFKLYALDILSDKEAGLTKAGLIKEMEGHILSQAQLMGKYKR